MNPSNSLPSWATYAPQSDPGKTSLKVEEFQLRQRAYQCASQRVKIAHHKTIEKHVHQLSKSLRRFFERFQPDTWGNFGAKTNVPKHNQKKRKREDPDDKEDVNALRLDFQKYVESIHYHPTLLPIAVINSSPSVQDRAHIVRAIKRYFTLFPKAEAKARTPPNEIQIGQKETTTGRTADTYTGHADFRPAVCIVTDSVSGVGYRDHGEYIRDILYQCIQQESNPYEYTHLLAKRSTKSLKLGYTHRLIEWASQTELFNSIVVIFENPEAIPYHNLDALTETISNLRSSAGIPICIAFTFACCQGMLSTLTSSALGGESGAIVKDFNFATVSILYNEFFQNLYTGRRLPVILSSESFQNLRDDFHQYHKSITGALLELKVLLAHHFSKRGSFFSMANDEDFLKKYGINLAWFCADSFARTWVFGSNYFHNSSELLICQRQSYNDLSYRLFISNLSVAVKKWVLEGEDDDASNGNVTFIVLSRSQLEQVYEKVRKTPLEDLVNTLAQWYMTMDNYSKGKICNDLERHLCMENNDSVDGKIKGVLGMLQRSVFFLEQMKDCNGKENVIKHLREDLVEKLHSMLWDNEASFESKEDLSSFTKFCIEDTANSSYQSSQMTEPRRMTASSISKPTSLSDDQLFDASIALNVMNSRVVSTNIWFEKFVENLSRYSYEEEVPLEDLLQRFAFAVYQLMYCGFVVRSIRKDDAFEKAAMVWASNK